MSYTGWELPPTERSRLLSEFPPKYPDVIAHHVTLHLGGKPDVIPLETEGLILGISDDGVGVEALVVSIGGTTNRPKGGTFHITWSLDRAAGMSPKMSKTVIETHGWKDITPIPITLTPMFFGNTK